MPACPHCGHEAEAPTEECPLCGTPLTEAADGAPGAEAEAADGGSAETAAPADPVPWEDPRLGFGPGIGRTWRESLFDPAGFFRRIRGEGTVARPLLYYLLVTVVGSFATVVWQTQGLTLTHYAATLRMGETSAAGSALSFVLSPFVALVVLVVATLIFHLGALMVAPDRRGMGATAKVVCYAAGPSVLAVVPVVGAPGGAVWSLVLQVVGLREAHRTTTPRALFMVFWLWGGFVVFALLLAALAAALGGGGGGELVLAPGGPVAGASLAPAGAPAPGA